MKQVKNRQIMSTLFMNDPLVVETIFMYVIQLHVHNCAIQSYLLFIKKVFHNRLCHCSEETSKIYDFCTLDVIFPLITFHLKSYISTQASFFYFPLIFHFENANFDGCINTLIVVVSARLSVSQIQNPVELSENNTAKVHFL